MKLRAHPNVISLSAWKRERRRVPIVRVEFPSFASERLHLMPTAREAEAEAKRVQQLRPSFAGKLA